MANLIVDARGQRFVLYEMLGIEDLSIMKIVDESFAS